MFHRQPTALIYLNFSEPDTYYTFTCLQSPNIKRHLMRRRQESVEQEERLSSAPSIAQINGCLQDNDGDGDSGEFLPEAVHSLGHEGQDVLRQLLAIEPRQRIRSVMALQRIALYKGYKLSAKRLLGVSANRKKQVKWNLPF